MGFFVCECENVFVSVLINCVLAKTKNYSTQQLLNNEKLIKESSQF